MSRRKARFPLPSLSLAAAFEGRHAVRIIDGNKEPDGVGAALRARRRGNDSTPSGVTVMGGPQVRTAIAVSQAVRARFATNPDHLGRLFSDAVS